MLFVFFIHIPNNINNQIKPIKIFKKSFNLIFSSKQNIAIIIYEATGRLQFYIPVIVQSLLTNNKINIKIYGIIYSIVQIIIILTQANANKLLTKIGSKRIFIVSTVLLSVSTLFISIQKNAWIIIGFALISAIGPVRNQPLMVIKNNLVNNEIRSTYLSSISCIVLLINSIMLSFIGFIYEQTPLVALIVLSFFVLIGGIGTVKRIENKPA